MFFIKHVKIGKIIDKRIMTSKNIGQVGRGL